MFNLENSSLSTVTVVTDLVLILEGKLDKPSIIKLTEVGIA